MWLSEKVLSCSCRWCLSSATRRTVRQPRGLFIHHLVRRYPTPGSTHSRFVFDQDRILDAACAVTLFSFDIALQRSPPMTHCFDGALAGQDRFLLAGSRLECVHREVERIA